MNPSSDDNKKQVDLIHQNKMIVPKENDVEKAENNNKNEEENNNNNLPKRKRLWYIDWLRNQSIINVVLGHIWWDVMDQTGLSAQLDQRLKPWNEASRMYDYAVMQGTLHTIPMFFLVSGYLTALTMRVHRKNGLKRFVTNRVMRLVPPFILGVIFLWLAEHFFLGREEFTADFILFSHLWFLIVLAGITIGCLPFHIIARTIIMDDDIVFNQQQNGENGGGEDDTKHDTTGNNNNNNNKIIEEKKQLCGLNKNIYIPIALLINVIVISVFPIIFDVVFNVMENGRGTWLFAVPFCGTMPLLFLYIGATIRKTKTMIISAKFNNNMVADFIQVFGCLLIPMSMFFFLGTSPICSLPSPCPSQYMSVNFTYNLNLVAMCNLCGQLYGEIRERVNRVVNQYIDWTHALAVFVLLMSWAWPFFTYWGPIYMRRTAFLTTYQEKSKFPIYDFHNSSSTSRTYKYVVDPLYLNGNGVSWSLARMWFWMIAMMLFAKKYCDYQINKFFHAHITQSGMIFYLLHRCFTPVLSVVFYTEHEIKDAGTLFVVVSIVTYIICFAIYALFISNKYTRMMFGLLEVK